MIFEKQIVNAFKKQMYTRCDDNGIAYYFSADDFEGARLAVLARCIPNMDTNSINTTDAVANGDVRYPEKWYKARGIEPTKKTDNDRKEEQNASEPES